eukprot:g3056.t1
MSSSMSVSVGAVVTKDENLDAASRLLLACGDGQVQVVESLLESGRARPDGNGWAPLTSAEVEGNSGDWHYWRDRACDYDPTPLHQAASHGHAGIVGALLASGARRNPRASAAKCLALAPAHRAHDSMHGEAAVGGVTPLHLAAQLGRAEVVEALVEAGANVNILGGARAEPPLHLATRYGHTAAMLALLRKGADIDAGNCRNQTALHEARSAPALELLLASGADKNGRSTGCAEPLRLTDTPLGALVVTTDMRVASESEAQEATNLVEMLLRHGAHASVPLAPHHHQGRMMVDSMRSGGATTPESSPCPALYPVVSSASTTASDWSLETSGSSDSLSETGDIAQDDRLPPYHGSPSSESTECCCWTPSSMWVGPPSSSKSLLPRAAGSGVPGIVAALLHTGLDPSELDEHRTAPLHYAAEGGHPEVVRLLLQAGAEVDSATPKERWTPLHVACRRARLECVLELLRWGANLNALCVLSEDDFGLEHGDDDFHRTPLQVVGWADSFASLGPHEKEEAERRHSCIRRALLCEDRWRRRGGVVVLRCLLLKRNDPRGHGPTPDSGTPTPLSRNCFSHDASIIPLANCVDGDRVGAPWPYRNSKSVHPLTPSNDTGESPGGEEGGKKRWRSVLISTAEEDKDSRGEEGDRTMHALAGLVRLGRIKESLYRKVVRYL